MDELQVWIPAQAASTRVLNKNFRPFYKNNSLLDIKVSQLIKAGVQPRQIYISTDCEDITILNKYEKVNIIKRNTSLLGNSILQTDLFKHFFQNTPESEFVMWVQVTDPLFSNFRIFLNKLVDLRGKNKTLVLATKLQKHAFFNNLPLNFQFGDWHAVSQDIEPIIIPRWSVFLHVRTELEKLMYHFGRRNEFIAVDDPYVDIDTMQDFELAKAIYGVINDVK